MLEPSGFREIARSATTTYPIPFLFALCLAFVVLMLGGAIIADGSLRWALFAIGALGFVFGGCLVGYAVLRRPELLRTEHHQVVNRVLDLIEGDSDLPPAKTIESFSKLLGSEPRSKRQGDQRES